MKQRSSKRHGRRIDQHDAGEDMMKGYVPRSKPVEAQREFVRQQARKHPDGALLVEMLLGEKLTDWQAEVIDRAAASVAGDVEEQAPAPVVELRVVDERQGVDGLVVIDEAHVWRQANPAIGPRLVLEEVSRLRRELDDAAALRNARGGRGGMAA